MGFELSEKQSELIDVIFAASNEDCTEVNVNRLAEVLGVEKNAASAKYNGIKKTLIKGGQTENCLPKMVGVGSRGRGKMTPEEKAAHEIAKAVGFADALQQRREKILLQRASNLKN